MSKTVEGGSPFILDVTREKSACSAKLSSKRQDWRMNWCRRQDHELANKLSCPPFVPADCLALSPTLHALALSDARFVAGQPVVSSVGLDR